MINNVGLIGVGRFGKVLANILKKGFHVKAYDIVPSKISGDLEKCELEEILKLDHIFIAVPIRYFEPLIKEVSKKINHPSTIIDVCSVKKHTSEIPYRGKIYKSINDLAKYLGINPFTLGKRIRDGLPEDEWGEIRTRTLISTGYTWEEAPKNLKYAAEKLAIGLNISAMEAYQLLLEKIEF